MEGTGGVGWGGEQKQGRFKCRVAWLRATSHLQQDGGDGGTAPAVKLAGCAGRIAWCIKHTCNTL
eukprot:1139079-Pelagomonas_calceolata.AAC.7